MLPWRKALATAVLTTAVLAAAVLAAATLARAQDDPPAPPAPPDPQEIIGQPAPKWGVKDWINLPEGQETLDIGDFAGRIVVLICCQKTCGGSQSHALPLAKELATRYADDKAVAVVVVQTAFMQLKQNTFEAVPEMAEKHGLKVPFGHAGEQGKPPMLLVRYKARGTPWVFVIDKASKVRKSGNFFPPQELAQLIEQLKAEPAAGGEPGTGPDQPTKPAEPPKPPEPLSEAAVKLKEQLDQVASQLEALLAKEMDLKMAIMTAQQKAMQVVKDADAASKELAKGRGTADQKAYGALMMTCARHVQTYEAKVASIQKGVERLERNPASKELQAEFAALNKQIDERLVSLLDQMAGFLEKAGNTGGAVNIYRGLLTNTPVEDKTKRRAYAEKIAGAYERAEDWPKALQFYMDVYDHIPPEKQKQEINLRIAIGNLYQRTGDYEKALEMYKLIKKDLPPGRTIGGLDNIIAQLEVRVNKKG